MSRTNIFTAETTERVAAAEYPYDNPADTDAAIADLVVHLRTRCAEPAVRARYDSYTDEPGTMDDYPVDAEGCAVAFDPLENEAELYDTWQKYGVAVARDVVPSELCVQAVKKVYDTVDALSEGACTIDDAATYDALPVDAAGVPILSRGFFEVYHDDALAQLRQSVRLYLHHVVLWGKAELWTTFDRFGVKLPGHTESAALPLHVDQNPNIHPDFRTTQGVLALEDCPAERGTLVVAPGSKSRFAAYGRMALNKGEYVQLDTADAVAADLTDAAKPLPLRTGNIVSWDSRTTHANSANLSDRTRFIALISAGPARSEDHAALMARAEAFETGVGSNVRDALMHASMKPRYSNEEALAAIRRPEQLSLLGRFLYGQVEYDDAG